MIGSSALVKVEAALGKRSLAEFIKICWSEVDPAELKWEPHLDEVCKHLEAIFYYDIEGPLVITIPPGLSKPVWVGEKVLTPLGEKPLGSVEVGDSVLTHKGRFRKVTAVHDQGVLPTVKITTYTGREIVAAPDHPFLTPSGWKQAADLTDSDALAIVQAPQSTGKDTISPEEARFLGYMVGDGSCKNHPQFTQSDTQTMEDFCHCVRSIGLDTSEVRSKPGCPNAKYVNIIGGRPSKSKALLDSHGMLGKSSYTKRIPAAVFEGNNEVLANFVGAYWSCDGHVKVRHTKPKKVFKATLTTVGKDLAYDLQRAMWQLGIQVRVRRRVSNLKTKVQGDSYVSYEVLATDQDQVAKVASLPGLSDVKRNNAPGCPRKDFDRTLRPDPVVSVEKFDSVECRCLTVDEDESFTVQGVAVHNSIITNVFFPAWAWTVDPGFRMGFIGNDLPLVRRDARKCRALIESDFYQERWPLELTDDSNRIEEFTNSEAGARQCFTMKQQITGHHFHIILIDDPHKPQAFNVGDGNNEAAFAAEVYDQVLQTRFVDATKKRFVLIMQRLAENDLAGHVLEKEENAEHLCLPMEYVPEKRCVTSLGGDWRAYEGELLAPERFPADAVEKLKKSMRSARHVSAQLQQEPIPDDGIIFRSSYFSNRYEELPERVAYYLSFDFTFKGIDTADYVVGTVWGLANRYIHLVDMIRGKWGFAETLRQTLTLAEKYPQYRGMLVEEKANGAAIIDALSSSQHGRKIVPVKVGTTTKVERAFATTPLFENNMVLFPKNEPWWWASFYKELLNFPSGRYDDIVDSTSQALLYMGSAQAHDMQKVLTNMRKVLPSHGYYR